MPTFNRSPKRIQASVLGLATCSLALVIGCASPANVTTTTTTTTPPASPAATTVYLAGVHTNTVYAYSATASGTASPTATLTLPQGNPAYSVTTDASGQIYVGAYPNVVLVYPAGSTGSAAPSRSFNVPNAPFQLYVDAAGLTYVGLAGGLVSVYANNASGAATPIRTITASNLQVITAVVTDSAGYVYISGQTTSNANMIDVFSSSNSTTPSRTISYPYLVSGMALDSDGDLFAAADLPYAVGLVEFSPNASGSSTPFVTDTLDYSLSSTAFSGGLKRDAAGNLYMLETPASNSPTVSVLAFAPTLTSTSTPFVRFNASLTAGSYQSLGLK